MKVLLMKVRWNVSMLRLETKGGANVVGISTLELDLWSIVQRISRGVIKPKQSKK